MEKTAAKTIAAIIVAAGRGLRAGGDIPKQWQPLGTQPVIDWTLDAFRRHPQIHRIVVVIHPDDEHRLQNRPDLQLATGGATRAASVRAGLEALADNPPDLVLIHDAARACVSQAILSDVIDALNQSDGAAPGVAVTDALWREDNHSVAQIQPRTHLYRAQTPQGFRFAAIHHAHQSGQAQAADDVELAIASGIDVTITEGHEDNLKITTPADFTRAQRILNERSAAMDVRTGNGFDVHALGPGDYVTLCGIAVPHTHGLIGHSDADVGMHAITDAIYGALAEGDIGRHFPPSDAKWKGAASHIFLDHAVSLAGSKGYAISNVDCTLICETPKIGPHADAMRDALASILKIDLDRISVKATTSERLGFTGRSEGIAASATATLVKS